MVDMGILYLLDNNTADPHRSYVLYGCSLSQIIYGFVEVHENSLPAGALLKAFFAFCYFLPDVLSIFDFK